MKTFLESRDTFSPLVLRISSRDKVGIVIVYEVNKEFGVVLDNMTFEEWNIS